MESFITMLLLFTGLQPKPFNVSSVIQTFGNLAVSNTIVL